MKESLLRVSESKRKEKAGAGAKNPTSYRARTSWMVLYAVYGKWRVHSLLRPIVVGEFAIVCVLSLPFSHFSLIWLEPILKFRLVCKVPIGTEVGTVGHCAKMGNFFSRLTVSVFPVYAKRKSSVKFEIKFFDRNKSY